MLMLILFINLYYIVSSTYLNTSNVNVNHIFYLKIGKFNVDLNTSNVNVNLK